MIIHLSVQQLSTTMHLPRTRALQYQHKGEYSGRPLHTDDVF